MNNQEPTQQCVHCQTKIPFHPSNYFRFPLRLCDECKQLITDKENNRISYSNSDMSGGIIGYYYKNGVPDQSKPYFSIECYLDGRKYYAQEARFGGVIISAQNESAMTAIEYSKMMEQQKIKYEKYKQKKGLTGGEK